MSSSFLFMLLKIF